MYVLTEQEVARMNADSNVLGCVPLEESSETAAIPYPIAKGTSDTFYCFPYRGRKCVAAITIVSEDADLYGISVGDSGISLGVDDPAYPGIVY